MKIQTAISATALTLSTIFSIGCSYLGNNPIIRASAYHPNNWIARSLVNYAENEKIAIANILKKNPSDYTKEESIEIAEYMQSNDKEKAAISYWILAGQKGHVYGYCKAGDICKKLKKYKEAYSLYYIAHKNNSNRAKEKMSNIEDKLQFEEKGNIEKNYNSILSHIIEWSSDHSLRIYFLSNKPASQYTARESLFIGETFLNEGKQERAMALFVLAGYKGEAKGYYIAALLADNMNNFQDSKALYYLGSINGDENAKKKWGEIEKSSTEDEINNIKKNSELMLSRTKSILENSEKLLKVSYNASSLASFSATT